jgi:hypothetical protein
VNRPRHPQAPAAPEPEPGNRQGAPQPPRTATRRSSEASREDRESRYRRGHPPASSGQDPDSNRVLRLTLTEPETVPMTEEQRQQAVNALAAMIASWLRRRAHDSHKPQP